VSDDGGLEIDALHGEPGVYSRRWPGHEATDQELIDLALSKLSGVSWDRRSAHLRTVGAFHDGSRTLTATAAIDGHIAERQISACEPGYPFRSIFWVDRFGKLYSDLSLEEHEIVNHRRVVYAELAQRIA
jgi:XTP/dITP diphosphohydrolase